MIAKLHAVRVCRFVPSLPHHVVRIDPLRWHDEEPEGGGSGGFVDGGCRGGSIGLFIGGSLFLPFSLLLFLSPRNATSILSVSLTAEGSSLVPLPFGRSPFVHNGHSIPILFSPGYT